MSLVADDTMHKRKALLPLPTNSLFIPKDEVTVGETATRETSVN